MIYITNFPDGNRWLGSCSLNTVHHNIVIKTFTAFVSLPVIIILIIMPSALIILAEGAEEIEFVGTVDVLRRAGV